MKAVAPLVKSVRSWLRRHSVRLEGMVVAVSGGPDSVALLRALIELRPQRVKGLLVIAHLNHQLRGAESDGDEAFVAQMFESLTTPGAKGLELRCTRMDVAARASAEGENLESMARQVRYDWLTSIAQETGCQWIATGHTADDQAETVLHRLLRGSGLKGLAGIAARRQVVEGVEVIRPLLQVPRSEVIAYLHGLGQSHRQDSSNLDLRFTRNRIRHELLPLLIREYNPAIAEVLCRLAEQSTDTYREEEQRALVLLAEAELPRAGDQCVFDRQRLSKAKRNLIREMFRLVWSREGWPIGAMTFDHWDRLAAVAFGEAPAWDLPGGQTVTCRPRVVILGPRK